MGLGSKAHNLYGQQNTVGPISAVPRSKFNFTVSMTHLNPSALGGLSTTFFERISSISMPSYSVKAQTLNQYNKKRVVQTGIDYAPITMLAYDTRDGVFEQFLKEYSEYYYTGSMNYGTSFVEFNNKSQVGTKLQDRKHFINQITIERKNSNIDTNLIKIYNPLITNIDADTLDYSDSGLVQYRITFIYEGFDITTQDYQSPQTLEPLSDRELPTGPGGDQPLPVTSPPEPSLLEQEDDLVETTQPVDDDIVDNRTEEEISPPLPAGQAVDNSALDTREVVAQSTDPTGAVDEQIVEETSVEPDGTTTMRTFKETPPEEEYRVYDEYVGVPVEDIPEDKLDAIAASGAYREGEDGTLENYADQRSFNEINREAIDTTKWVNRDAVRGVGYDEVRGRWRAYNPKTNTYSLHDSVEEANAAAVKGVE